MAKYTEFECLDCKGKVTYPTQTADGHRCKQCGSGLLLPSENIVSLSISETEQDLIIFNLLSERYAEFERKPNERDENKFVQIEFLYNFYKRKIEQHSLHILYPRSEKFAF